MKLAYGYTLQDDDDFFLTTIEKAFEKALQASQPGRWLVDYFPICTSQHLFVSTRNRPTDSLLLVRYVPSWFPLPGGNFKSIGKKLRVDLDNLTDVPHLWVKEHIVGIPRLCFIHFKRY